MFTNHGMSVDIFMAQRLDWFLKMAEADRESRVFFIDEVEG